MRLFDLTRLDARFDGEFLVETGIFMEHIRLPDEIKVNGSRYTKLERLLCSCSGGVVRLLPKDSVQKAPGIPFLIWGLRSTR